MLYTQDSLAFSSTYSFVLEHKVFYIDTKGKHRVGVPMNVTPRLKTNKTTGKPQTVKSSLISKLI